MDRLLARNGRRLGAGLPRRCPPELSRKIGRDCERQIGRSPWTRDGSLALFTCIRRRGEEAGYSYEFDEEPTAPAA